MPRNPTHQLSRCLVPGGAALYAWLGQGPWVAPHLWNEDRGSTSGSVSVLRGPGEGGRFSRRWAMGAGPRAGFAAQSHRHSSVVPFLIETSDFGPLGSWVQRQDGGAQLLGALGGQAVVGLWLLEGSESGLKGDVLSAGGGARGGRNYVWPRPGQLQVSLRPSVAGRPRPTVGVRKERRRGRADC